MCGSTYKRTVVYGVCGHCRLELVDTTGQKVSQHTFPFNSDRTGLLEGTECRAGLCGECAESRRSRRERPSALLSPSQASSRPRKVTRDHGLSVWVPGAHRSPTNRYLSPPPRTPTPLASCERHGKVDKRSVDMTCDRCMIIFLEESTVPPRSDLVKRRSVPAYCSTSYAFAAEGKCSCRPLLGFFCSPCKARAQISSETAGHVGSTWDWV